MSSHGSAPWRHKSRGPEVTIYKPMQDADPLTMAAPEISFISCIWSLLICLVFLSAHPLQDTVCPPLCAGFDSCLPSERTILGKVSPYFRIYFNALQISKAGVSNTRPATHMLYILTVGCFVWLKKPVIRILKSSLTHFFLLLHICNEWYSLLRFSLNQNGRFVPSTHEYLARILYTKEKLWPPWVNGFDTSALQHKSLSLC